MNNKDYFENHIYIPDGAKVFLFVGDIWLSLGIVDADYFVDYDKDTEILSGSIGIFDNGFRKTTAEIRYIKFEYSFYEGEELKTVLPIYKVIEFDIYGSGEKRGISFKIKNDN